MLTVIVLGDYC